MTVERTPIVPPGRLVRLGVVVDAAADPASSFATIAALSERVGLDTCWLRAEPDGDPTRTTRLVDELVDAAVHTSSIVLGVFLTEVPASLPERLHGRVEITVPADRVAPGSPGVIRVSALLTEPPTIANPAEMVVLPAAESLSAPVLGMPARGLLAVVTRACIGRTSAEVQARLGTDSAPPLTGEVIGTLEECQAQLLALAQLGVVDVRCVVPRMHGLHDLLAQLPAAAAGTLGALSRPGRSPHPPPPAGWGGRSHRPVARCADPSPG